MEGSTSVNHVSRQVLLRVDEYCNNDILQKNDFTDIITEFASLKSRKLWCKLLHQTVYSVKLRVVL